MSLTDTLSASVAGVGSATAVPSISVDKQGRVTAVSSVAIAGVTPGGIATGDLYDNYPNPKVGGIRNTPVSATAPALGQVLKYMSSNWAASTLELNDLKAADGTTSVISGANCGSAQTMYYDFAMKSLACKSIGSLASTAITDLDAAKLTGIIDYARLPADAKLWFESTGNVYRSAGSVGIGTSIPSADVEVYKSQDALAAIRINNPNPGAAARSGLIFGNDSNNSSGYIQYASSTAAVPHSFTVGNGQAAPLIFNTGNVEKVRIDAGGRLGVGTSNPALKLHVFGTAGFSGAAVDSFPTSLAGGFGGQAYVNHAAGNYGLVVSRAANDVGTANMVFYHTRSTDPSSKIGLASGDGLGTIAFQGPVDSSNTLSGAAIFSAVDSNPLAGPPGTGLLPAAIGFSTSADTAGPSERMRISSSGNVGIGTKSPNAALDISSTSTTQANTVIRGDTSAYWPQVSLWFVDAAPGGRSYSVGNGGSTGSFAIADQTVGQARLSIGSTGNVGIGTATPTHKLNVIGDMLVAGSTTNGNIYVSNAGLVQTWGVVSGAGSNGYFAVWDATHSKGPLAIEGNSPSNSIFVRNDGNVGISTNNPSYRLDVAGTIRGYGITDSSDLRLKQDVRALTESLTNILKLRGVSYVWKNSDMARGRQVGLIAQEVEQIFPELVATDKDGFKSINYSHLVAPLIDSIKLIFERVTRSEARIEAMEKSLSEVTDKFKALEASNEQLRAENQDIRRELSSIRSQLKTARSAPGSVGKYPKQPTRRGLLGSDDKVIGR